MGYEELNNHDTLRRDPLLAVLVGKRDPTGEDRTRQRDKGKVLAGKNTLERFPILCSGGQPASPLGKGGSRGVESLYEYEICSKPAETHSRTR